MGWFVARRLAGMVAVLFAISVIVFLIFNVIPSNDPALRMAGKNATPDSQLVANIREEWGFDESLPQQYLTMMEKIFTGDLVSYSSQLNVDEEIWKGLPATLSLCFGAALLWMSFGILFGYLSAVRAGRFTDRVLTVVALAGISMPVFLLASIFLVYLTFRVELFPASGYVPLTENPLDWAYHLILPWVTLAVLFVGFYSRVLRSNMLETMNEDYVRTARAKGLDERRVRTRHVLRNSLIPIVTLFGLDFAAVIGGGAIITETIFNLGGVGQYAADSISNLDLPPIMAVTLFGAFFVVLFNTVVDIVYAYLDPRIRLGASST
jgi:peptide/nickel transport system permease protein